MYSYLYNCRVAMSSPAANNSFKPSPLRGLGPAESHRAGRLNSGVRSHLKYIARLYDHGELLQARDLLHSKGIPTHEISVGGGKLIDCWALYVCLPEHAEDALQVLHNPDHEPANPVDVTPFLQAVQNPDLRLLSRLVTITLLVAIPLFIGLVYLVRRFG